MVLSEQYFRREDRQGNKKDFPETILFTIYAGLQLQHV